MAETPSTTSISPKVKAQVVTGSAIGIVLTAVSVTLSLVTPEMFSGLGPYAILVSAFLMAIGSGIAGYMKSDPARVSPAEVQKQVEDAVNAAVSEYEAAEARRKLKEEAEAATKPEVAATDPVEFESDPSVIG